MSALITAERLRELLYYEPATGVLTWLVSLGRARLGNVAGSPNNQGYWHIEIDGRKYKAHRLAWLYVTGAWPLHQIDHINMDPSDNRWCNLREASNSRNRANANARVDSTSGFKGVSWRARDHKWAAISE